jgi:hypothetical protein
MYAAVASDPVDFVTVDAIFTIWAVVVLDLHVCSGKVPTEIWSGYKQFFEARKEMQPEFVALRATDRQLT